MSDFTGMMLLGVIIGLIFGAVACVYFIFEDDFDE